MESSMALSKLRQESLWSMEVNLHLKISNGGDASAEYVVESTGVFLTL